MNTNKQVLTVNTEQARRIIALCWKAQGKSVKKGERGFPIWSEPRKVEVKTETGTQTVTRYSLVYIFHEGQVRENEKTATANA